MLDLFRIKRDLYACKIYKPTSFDIPASRNPSLWQIACYLELQDDEYLQNVRQSFFMKDYDNAFL